MTSSGLGELKKLINEAAQQRAVLRRKVDEDAGTLSSAERKLAWSRTFIVRLFTARLVPKLIVKVHEAELELEDSRFALDACYVDIDFGLDNTAINSFNAMCSSFDALRTCSKIWDITARSETNQVKERTTATYSYSRTGVGFNYSQLDFIKTQYRTLRFATATGLELHLSPGFIITKDTGSDFALIEWSEATIQYSPSKFIEVESPPADSQVVGQTWSKANKDGSQDKRFSDNRKIPIMLYGELWFRSHTGMLEAFMVSNSSTAQSFSNSVENHKRALLSIVAHPGPAPTVDPASDPSEMEHEQISAPVIPPPPNTILDLIALGCLVVGICYLAFTSRLPGNVVPPTTSVTQGAQVSRPVTPVAGASAPSFNCAKVKSAVLKLVCNTPDLAALDRQLSNAYQQALSKSNNPVEVREAERDWIRSRNNSAADVQSLQAMYQIRIGQLNGEQSPSAPSAQTDTLSQEQKPTVGSEPELAPQQSAPTDAAASQGKSGHWYYCDPAKAYYPYVQRCPVPWRAVEPTSENSATSNEPGQATGAPASLTPLSPPQNGAEH